MFLLILLFINLFSLGVRKGLDCFWGFFINFGVLFFFGFCSFGFLILVLGIWVSSVEVEGNG